MNKRNNDHWRKFLQLCVQLKSVEELKRTFDLFMTIEERESIALRYQIIKELLEQEKTQREMAKDLRVSIAKITRGSNSLKTIDDKLRRLLTERMS